LTSPYAGVQHYGGMPPNASGGAGGGYPYPPVYGGGPSITSPLTSPDTTPDHTYYD
jgi:hypothetical protein